MHSQQQQQQQPPKYGHPSMMQTHPGTPVAPNTISSATIIPSPMPPSQHPAQHQPMGALPPQQARTAMPSVAPSPTANAAARPRVNRDELVNRFKEKLAETGERQKLREILRSRLIECGWQTETTSRCEETIKQQGLENVTLEQLVRSVYSQSKG